MGQKISRPWKWCGSDTHTNNTQESNDHTQQRNRLNVVRSTSEHLTQKQDNINNFSTKNPHENSLANLSIDDLAITFQRNNIYVERRASNGPSSSSDRGQLKDNSKITTDFSEQLQPSSSDAQLDSTSTQETQLNEKERIRENRNRDVRERKKRIKDLLQQLPESRPTLCDLPKKLWWKLYIDVPMHKIAEQLDDPGALYDTQKSPGYQQSMMNLFNTVLAAEQTNEQSNLNYEGYTKRHELVTEYTPEREVMRQPNGIDEKGDFTAHDIPSIPKGGPEQLERLEAIRELCNERVNGLPLLHMWKPAPGVEFGLSTLPKAITVGAIFPGLSVEPNSISIIPVYSASEGPQHVNAIFTSYDEGRKAPNETGGRRLTTEYRRLREIARTIRNLHVLHQKRDANGRTNVYGILYESLQKEGFSLTTLPSGPAVFGGIKTLDGLVEDILVGMHSFIEDVNQNKHQKIIDPNSPNNPAAYETLTEAKPNG